jgi:hypothetical protein
MLGLWVVPRFTRSALKRKLIFLKGAGGQKGDFLADFLAFSLGLCCPRSCSPVAVALVAPTFATFP